MPIIIFTVLLAIHGIIHIKAAYTKTLNKDIKGIKKPFVFRSLNNPFLIITGFLFLVAAILLVEEDILWLVVCLFAVFLSQYLIIINWRNFRYGTGMNVLIVVAMLLAYTSLNTQRSIDGKLCTMYDQSSSPLKVTQSMIRAQPELIQKWLLHANVLDKSMSEFVYLEQKGRMRTSPSGAWMDVNAKEYFTTTSPAFLWIAEVDGGTLMKLKGVDQYRNGKGHMQIQWYSAVPVVNSSGSQIDQGCLLRYLAEMVWFPSAALKPYIKWQQLDSLHAMATMEYKQAKASGIFTFNTSGDVVSFEARRYYDRKEGATLEDWLIGIDTDSYREFEGVRVPAVASISWKLKTGTFNWYNLEIQSIRYNPNSFISQDCILNTWSNYFDE